MQESKQSSQADRFLNLTYISPVIAGEKQKVIQASNGRPVSSSGNTLVRGISLGNILDGDEPEVAILKDQQDSNSSFDSKKVVCHGTLRRLKLQKANTEPSFPSVIPAATHNNVEASGESNENDCGNNLFYH